MDFTKLNQEAIANTKLSKEYNHKELDCIAPFTVGQWG